MRATVLRHFDDLILGLVVSLLSLVGRLLGASWRRMLAIAHRVAAAVEWVLALCVPGSFQLAHTVATRVRMLLEHSAALALDTEEEPLQQRLAGLPPPAAACLRAALAELPPGAPDFKVAHLKLAGHMRFAPPSSGTAPPPPAAWQRLQADCYLCPGNGSSSPGYVLSAVVQLGPFSWVRGFASWVQGVGSSQWKLCSPFRARDLDATRGVPGSAPLAAFLAQAPCCPTALLPSATLRWRAVSESSAEAIVRGDGSEASAIYHFDRMGRIIKASLASPSTGGRAGAGLPQFIAAASRGAGSLAGSAATGATGASGSSTSSPAVVLYYRQHQQRCGMLVPTELEACWGEEASFLHCDVVDVSAWGSLDMAPGHAAPVGPVQ